MRVFPGHPERNCTEAFGFRKSIQRATGKHGQVRTRGTRFATLLFNVTEWSLLQFWLLYPDLFLTSDNNDRRKALARAYVQKVFANDRWKSTKDSSRDDEEGGALTPDNELTPPKVRKSQNIGTSLVDGDLIYFREDQGNLRLG
jgi:hypothetical protein